MNNQPIEAEVVEQQTMAVAKREVAGAVDKALTVDELKARLDFVKQVMGSVMTEGQDYGRVPGCGDKPGLFQPGAQKLGMTFQLTDHVKTEKITDLPNYHREYAFTVSVRSAAGREWDGVGTCSTLETKYRYRQGERKCPKCGKPTIIKGKAEFGGGWLCFAKKGGCGAKFDEKAPEIVGQHIGRVEHDNPADFWNTARKMAFKRGLVHAIINATNTSELWSQDLEDLAGNQSSDDFSGGPAEPIRSHAAPAVPQKPKDPAPAAPVAQQPAAESFENAAPAAPPKPAPADEPAVTGYVESVATKSGEKNGKPWTRYGIKINGEYYNTFDHKIGKACQAVVGQQEIHVTLSYKQTERGKDALQLINADQAF